MLDTTILKNPEERLFKQVFLDGTKAIEFLNSLTLGTIIEVNFIGGAKHLVQKKWIRTKYNEVTENNALWVYINNNHSNVCPLTEKMLINSIITIRNDIMEAFNLIVVGYQFLNKYYK